MDYTLDEENAAAAYDDNEGRLLYRTFIPLLLSWLETR
jgi:hypothetical protein